MGCGSAVLAFVDDDGEHDDGAFDDLLHEGGDVEEVHAVVDDADDEGADDGSPDGADAAVEAGAADDGGGDGVEFDAGAELGVAGADSGGEHDAGQAGQEAGEGEDADFDSVEVDARDAGGLFVAADGVGVAAEAGEVEDDVGGDGDDGQDPDCLLYTSSLPSRPSRASPSRCRKN